MWPLLIATAATSAAQSLSQGSQRALTNNAATLAAMQQETEQLKDQSRVNAAGLESNLKNMVTTNTMAGLVQMQAAQSRRSLTQERMMLGDTANLAKGSATANAAAAGTIGSSVDAVRQDIQRAVNTATIRADENYEIDMLNYQQTITDLYTNYDRGMNMPRMGRVSNLKLESAPSIGRSLLSGAISTVGNYAMQRMGLGLGEAAQSPIQSVNLKGGMGQAALGSLQGLVAS